MRRHPALEETFRKLRVAGYTIEETTALPVKKDRSGTDPVEYRIDPQTEDDRTEVEEVEQTFTCKEVGHTDTTTSIELVVKDRGGRTVSTTICIFLHLGRGVMRHFACLFGAHPVERLKCRHSPTCVAIMEHVAEKRFEHYAVEPQEPISLNDQIPVPFWSRETYERLNASPPIETSGKGRKNPQRRRSERTRKTEPLFQAPQLSSPTDTSSPARPTEKVTDRTAFSTCKDCGNRHPAVDPCSEWN